MNNETIRVIGSVYRELADMIPDHLPNSHLQQAAMRPLVWLTRAQHEVQAVANVPYPLQQRIRACSQSLPTSAVTDILYEEQQAAFMLGYNATGTDRPAIKGIRAMRKFRGLTQQQLSDLSGITRETIAYAETGKRHATVDTLKQLARSLSCLIDDLVE